MQHKASRITHLKDPIANSKFIADLPEEVQNLLRLATLLVDINYRHKSGRSLDWNQGRGYRHRDQTL